MFADTRVDFARSHKAKRRYQVAYDGAPLWNELENEKQKGSADFGPGVGWKLASKQSARSPVNSKGFSCSGDLPSAEHPPEARRFASGHQWLILGFQKKVGIGTQPADPELGFGWGTGFLGIQHMFLHPISRVPKEESVESEAEAASDRELEEEIDPPGGAVGEGGRGQVEGVSLGSGSV